MEKRRRVLLYGKSVILGSVGASLAQIPGLEIVPLAPPLPQARQLAALEPDVILFDLEAAHPDAALSLLQARPRLLLIGIDPATDEMLLWSGEHSRALSMQDLIRAIGAAGGEGTTPAAPAGKQVRIQEKSGRTPSTQANVSHHKEKGETKMKNWSKRSKILVGVAGGLVVVAIVVAVVFSQVGGGLLSGGGSLVVTPASATIVFPGTQSFQVASQSLNCNWSSDAPGIARILQAGQKNATVEGVSAGTTTIRVTCAGYTGTASVTVSATLQPTNPPPVQVGSRLTFRLGGGPTVPVTWNSTQTSVLRLVSATNDRAEFEGVAQGSANVMARWGQTTLQTGVTVVPAPAAISPASPALQVGESQIFTLNNGPQADLTWGATDATVVTLVSASGTTAEFRAARAGATVIWVHYPGETESVHTSVTVQGTMECVLGPDTGKTEFALGIGERMTVCCRADYDPQFTWESNSLGYFELRASGYAPGCIVVQGNAAGAARFKAYDNNTNTWDFVKDFTATTELTISPAYPSIKVGQSLALNNPSGNSGTWALLNCPSPCPISLTGTSGTSTTITGLGAGRALVTFRPDIASGRFGLTTVRVEP